MGRRFLGMEEPLALRFPFSEGTGVNTRYARTCRRAGTTNPRAVPHHQAVVHPTSSGNRSAFQSRQESPHGYGDREERPPRRYVVRVPQQGDTPRHHACRSPREGPHAGWQRRSRGISCLHFLSAKAKPLRSFRTGAVRRAQP